MKTIIRIEHADGWGMFNSKDTVRFQVGDSSGIKCLNALWKRHSAWNTKGMPIPRNDNIDLELKDKEWFCAFRSMEEFKKWVKPVEVKALIKKGFKILLLDVSEYQEGTYQIAYTKESIQSMKDISALY